MGKSSSKFRKHLQNGDEVQALQIYTTNSELRENVDPNLSYGVYYQHETPLHYASRHGMKTLLRLFLYDKGANPDKTNMKKETSLHCCCMERNSQFYNVQKRRVECLQMIINWRGGTLQDGQVEKVNIAAVDEKKNTALHYAAASGLRECVEILVQHGAPLTMESENNWTPCESAEKNGYDRIARYLESKIVFSNDQMMDAFATIDEYCGLCAQDLQQAKDQLLVETADMLNIPLFTAEALLRNNEWSRETLLDAWMEDAVSCCERSGVIPPSSLFDETFQVQDSLSSTIPNLLHAATSSSEAECSICMSLFRLSDDLPGMACQHHFCRQCWESYLTVKIQYGDAHNITCPGHGCVMLVPVEIIDEVVSPEMAQRYLKFDIKAFVDSNPDMKWCPYPECGRAVKLPGIASDPSGSLQDLSKKCLDTSRSVDCGADHYFCWDCLGDAHEPCSCENWVRWQQKVADVKPETLTGTEVASESAANCLWLVTNSKPCPNCKSPIQKNEGCNHMKCCKCKHDFCWVCLEQWKRHNSSTGGYFKCNRYEVVKKVEGEATELVSGAEEKNSRLQDLNRFVHYYSRFKNHENSYKLEVPLRQTVKDKMMKLAEAVTDIATAKSETQFVEDAVCQLLKGRLELKFSYIYGYYLDGPGYKKIVFELMQTELEECTEILSQMVNRLYLLTPRCRIIEQAHTVQRRRLELAAAIAKGLVPPDTPTTSLSRRRRRCRKGSMSSNEEDLRNVIMESIKEVDPRNPWVKDSFGRHANVMALLQWPFDDSDDSDTEVAVARVRHTGFRHSYDTSNQSNPSTQQPAEYFRKPDQSNDRRRSSLTSELPGRIAEVLFDEDMDLLRALEMSRLQFIQDSRLQPDVERSSNTGDSQLDSLEHHDDTFFDDPNSVLQAGGIDVAATSEDLNMMLNNNDMMLNNNDMMLNDNDMMLNNNDMMLNDNDMMLNNNDMMLNDNDMMLNDNDMMLNDNDMMLNNNDMMLINNDMMLNNNDMMLNNNNASLNNNNMVLNNNIMSALSSSSLQSPVMHIRSQLHQATDAVGCRSKDDESVPVTTLLLSPISGFSGAITNDDVSRSNTVDIHCGVNVPSTQASSSRSDSDACCQLELDSVPTSQSDSPILLSGDMSDVQCSKPDSPRDSDTSSDVGVCEFMSSNGRETVGGVAGVPSGRVPARTSAMFGAIKDLCVANVDVSGKDKMEEFRSKDFHANF